MTQKAGRASLSRPTALSSSLAQHRTLRAFVAHFDLRRAIDLRGGGGRNPFMTDSIMP